MSVSSSVFGAAVALRNAMYDRRVLRVESVAAPVVSIGNISVGGAGKTPFTIALGEELKRRGVRFDVLSRGYGRKSSETLIVDPNGTPRQFGDEPLLIARKLDVPVIVSARRLKAGIVGEREFGSELHLLDDGFQHRELARDFDIVLLTAQDMKDKLLPAGRLREPLAALSRADAIVMYEDLPLPRALARKFLWRAHRNAYTINIPARQLAFCAIARPQNFFSDLRIAGVDPAAEFAFRDHRAYVAQDIVTLHALAKQSGAQGFITTEKDAINLGELVKQLTPLHIVPLQTVIQNAETVVSSLLAAVEQRRASRA